jgi:hypothetical protein
MPSRRRNSARARARPASSLPSGAAISAARSAVRRLQSGGRFVREQVACGQRPVREFRHISSLRPGVAEHVSLRNAAVPHSVTPASATTGASRRSPRWAATRTAPGLPADPVGGTGRLLVGDGRGHGVGVPEAGGAGAARAYRGQILIPIRALSPVGPRGCRAAPRAAGTGRVGLPLFWPCAHTCRDVLCTPAQEIRRRCRQWPAVLTGHVAPSCHLMSRSCSIQRRPRWPQGAGRIGLACGS